MHLVFIWGLFQFNSVARSCPTLCNPMNRSTLVLPVHHQLRNSRRLTSIESVMPSSHSSSVVPFSSCPQPLPESESFPMSQLFAWGGQSTGVSAFSIIPSKEIPGLISFRMDWLDLLVVQGTQESSPIPQFKSINSSALSLLHSPTLTSIHDHRKNHSLD